MSNVTIPFGENAENTAVLLLAAAQEMDLPASVITTGSFGNFYAPEEVADKAGVDYVADDAADEPEVVGEDISERAEPERYLVSGENEPTPSQVLRGVQQGGTVGEDPEGEEPVSEIDGPAEEYDPSDYNVEEVLAYLEANPDQRDSVILAEQQGKNRVTITESQE